MRNDEVEQVFCEQLKRSKANDEILNGIENDRWLNRFKRSTKWKMIMARDR